MTGEVPPFELRPDDGGGASPDASPGASPGASRGAPDAAPGVSGPVATVLEGECPHGPLSLSIRLGRDYPVPSCAVAHALHAAAAELHIAFLEWWLDAFLELRPAAAGTVVAPPLCSIAAAAGRGDGDDGNGVSVEVSLPGAAWGALPPLEAPATEAGWRVRWERCRTSVLLEDLAIAPGEAARVRPGATVLLPRSFDGPWRATLRADRSRAAREGIYDPQTSTWREPEAAPAEQMPTCAAPAGAVGTRLWACGTAPARLFTAHDSPRELDIGPGRSRACCLLALGGERWFRGHLLPIGAGFGLRVEAPLRPTRGPAAGGARPTTRDDG